MELAEGCVAARHRGAGEEAGSAARQARGHRQLRRLRRHRLAALLPAARPAAAGGELRAVRACAPKDIEAREDVRDWLIDDVAPQFPDAAAARDAPGERPAGRLSGAVPRLRRAHRPACARCAQQVAAKVRANPHVANVNLDWDEPSKVVRLEIDQERARALGVSSAQLAQLPARLAVGPARQHLPRRQRAGRDAAARRRTTSARGWTCSAAWRCRPPSGTACRCRRSPRSKYVLRGRHHLASQPPADRHRARRHLRRACTPPTVVAQILPTLEDIRAELPDGYLLETGGTVEDSARGQNSINAGVPLFLLVVVTLLMLQLRSFSRTVHGAADRAAGPDRRDAVPAGVPRAVRLRRDARHDRAGRHDHAQLGDPGRPDRAGHRAPATTAGTRSSKRPCAASARSC